MVRSEPGHVKNSLGQERVGHQQFELGHGIFHSPFLHHDLCHVERGERGVEGTVEFVGIPSLRVCQPAILLGITEAELDLEPCPVEVQDFLARERGVGGEEQLVLACGHDPDDEPHLALQGLGVGKQRVGLARQSVHDDGCHT